MQLRYCFFTYNMVSAISVDLTTYMTKFQWDRAKYPAALPLKTLTDLIFKVYILHRPYTCNVKRTAL